MEGISPFQSGRPLLSEINADKLNRILSEIKRNRPVVAAPLSARVTGDGTHISLGKLPSGGTPITRQPWDLIARVDPASDPENPDYLVSVQPGTLNGFLPSNYDTEGAGGAVDVPCLGTGLYYAKAAITTDGQAISEIGVTIDTTAPVTQEPQPYALEETIEYLFGLFSEGQVYRVIGPGDIVLRPEQWLVTPVDPPVGPGEAPYTIYYRLM